MVAPPPQVNYVPWSTGLFHCYSSCSNYGRYCISCWCPCITFGQISEIVDKGSSSCAANGAIYFLIASVTGCACCYSFCYRLKMRKQYGIVGNTVKDLLVHWFCEACALAQEFRELQNRGIDPSLGWHDNVGRQNHGVTMAPTPPAAPVVEGGMRR